MKKVLLLIICLLVFNKVYAYENDYFYLEIEDTFKEKTIEDKKYIFARDNDYISVLISDNTNEYDISKFTEEDIQKQKEYLESEYKEHFKDYSSNISITNIELKNTETQYYLEYDISYETKETIGHNVYQRCRMYTSNKYVYSILYNSDKEITNNDMLDTFKIKDSYLKKINIKLYGILLIIMLVFLLLLDFLFHKKRRSK